MLLKLFDMRRVAPPPVPVDETQAFGKLVFDMLSPLARKAVAAYVRANPGVEA